MGNVENDENRDVEIQKNLTTCGLNWTVRSEEIVTSSGIEIPDKMAIVRGDNQAVLGIHSNGYEIYQNQELMELLYQLEKRSGIKLHSGGSFGGGEKVWVQLKSTNDPLDLGGDKVIGYVSGINSFDGSTSLAFGNMTFTISCQNTFWRGYRSLDNKIRHSNSLRTRIDEILINLDIVLKEEKDMFTKIIRMSETPVVSQDVKNMVVRRLFDLKKEDTLESAINDPETSTRKKNQLYSFQDDMSTEIGQKGNNLWGIFSSVTRFTTHSMRKSGDNIQSKMVGMTGVKEREIYHELVELV